MPRANKKVGVGIAMQETKRAANHIRLENKERSGMTFRIMDNGAGIECRKMDILTAAAEMSLLVFVPTTSRRNRRILRGNTHGNRTL